MSKKIDAQRLRKTYSSYRVRPREIQLDGTTQEVIPVASPIVRVTDLDSNHIHAWELTETSGTTFYDTGASSSKVNLTITNPTFVSFDTPGLVGNCPLFGLNSTSVSLGTPYASTPVSSFTDLPTTAMTFEVWFQQTGATSTFSFVASCDFGIGSYNFQVGIGDAYNAYFLTFRTASTLGNAVPTLSQFAQPNQLYSQWVYMAVTYDGTAFRQYINGDLLKKESATGAIQWSYGSPAPTFYLGCQTANYFFTGRMSRVRMSNIARSETYIKDVYKKAILY